MYSGLKFISKINGVDIVSSELSQDSPIVVDVDNKAVSFKLDKCSPVDIMQFVRTLISHENATYRSRSKSIAITKLDEAMMWINMMKP